MWDRFLTTKNPFRGHFGIFYPSWISHQVTRDFKCVSNWINCTLFSDDPCLQRATGSGNCASFTLLLGDHLSDFCISHSDLRGFSRYTRFFSFVVFFLLTAVPFDVGQRGSSESDTHSPESCPYVCQIPPDAISIQVECALIPVVVRAVDRRLHSAASSASTASGCSSIGAGSHCAHSCERIPEPQSVK